MRTSQPSPGTLFLIPVPISGSALHTMSPEAVAAIHRIRHFIVENARSARRFIKTTNPPYEIRDLSIMELDKHADSLPPDVLSAALQGHPTGLMSEAGCPGVGDPGTEVVAEAHAKGIQVRPLVGPNSMILALMASGLNGQAFRFHGYLTPKRQQLPTQLKRLEELSGQTGATQLFIEAPYRNRQVYETCLSALHPATKLCIARDLTSDEEWIGTLAISEWRQLPEPDLHKRPAIFLLQAKQ